MRLAAMVLASALVFWGSGFAQTSNPVLEAYQSYRDALGRGDLNEAERFAQAALSASQQRDGDGGRTGVLALNLAAARLLNDDPDMAIAPARQALMIAEQNAQSGVDPLMARLVLGRAELAAGASVLQERTAARALLQSLQLARGRGDLVAESYAAAVDLGVWSFRTERYEDAETAWSIAAEVSSGANEDPELARAYAHIGIAAAIVMRSAGRNIRREEAERARDALNVAAGAFAPHLPAPLVGDRLTPVQNAFAQALAWRGALRSKVNSDHVDADIDTGAAWNVDIGPQPDPRPICRAAVVSRPLPTYPSRMVETGGVGAVVVHLRTNEEGDVVSSQVVAAVGEAFANATGDVPAEWRVRRLSDAAENCRMARSWLTTLTFRLG